MHKLVDRDNRVDGYEDTAFGRRYATLYGIQVARFQRLRERGADRTEVDMRGTGEQRFFI